MRFDPARHEPLAGAATPIRRTRPSGPPLAPCSRRCTCTRGPPRELDPLLIGAGTTIWNAGPLTKGHGLCHGTAGNGYAFLKLHRRTGDAVWLARARAFAMHALAQYQAAAAPRYSLWTGDAGLAVYLWHCVTGSDSLPGLDLV